MSEKKINVAGADNWQFHYVVVFNAETGEFSIDVDTTDAVFHNGQIFMPDSQEWYAPHDVDDPQMHGLLMDIEDQLSEVLKEKK